MLSAASEKSAEELEVCTFASAGELEAAQPGSFDALFLDIRLADADSTDGIDLAARLVPTGSRTQVVFVSGYDEYHTVVYRTPHAAYLKKPFRQTDVEMALELSLVAARREVPRAIVFRVKGSERIVSPSDITYLESDLRLVRVHLRRGDSFEVYGKLAALLDELPSRFVRCHQSFVINLDCVEELGTTEARLSDGATVPVSRRHRTSVREALFQHIRTKVGMR